MRLLQFASPELATDIAYSGSYSATLVTFSVIIAMVGAFACVSHVELINATKSAISRLIWTISGSLALGMGIWAMHFVGMLAYDSSFTIHFDPRLTFLSIIPAVFAGFVALRTLRTGQTGLLRYLVGGCLIGLGIGVMHYSGMAGMLISVNILYNPFLFALSLLFAVAVSTAFLAVPSLLRRSHRWSRVGSPRSLRYKILSAGLMGIAISSLHYMGMAAMVIMPSDSPFFMLPEDAVDQSIIVLGAVVTSALVLMMSGASAILGFKLIASDASAETSALKALQLEDRFAKLVSRLPGMVYQFKMDPNGRFSFPYASPAIESIYGVSPEQVINDAQYAFRAIHPDDAQAVSSAIQESAEHMTTWRQEYRVLVGDEFRWVEGNSVPEKLDNGSVLWSGFITDITEKKNAERKIHDLVFYDDLTGLPNRRLYEDRIDMALSASQRHGTFGAVMYIDLDDFKSLNDTLGHNYGDTLLQNLAALLSKTVRETDTVARLGGDEFVLIVNELSSSESTARLQAEKLAQKIIATLDEPLSLGTVQYQCEASVGVVLFKGKSVTKGELLKRADTAMYESKAAGRCQISFYDPDVQSSLAKRFNLEIELRQAIEREELYLVYQRQIGAQHRCVGVEALLRWNHAEQGFIPPGEFIPIAESNGKILELGRWVIKQACRQLAEWQSDPKTSDLTLSINVSSRQFYQPDFVREMIEIAREFGANPAKLCIEVTESMVLADLDDALEKMRLLRNAGFVLSMDDFGTGYSSMAYLSKLPFNEVKIDKTFVQEAGSDRGHNEWIIIETIITMAHKLGMTVTAEGVETHDQYERLNEMGCDLFQGFYLGRPAELAQLDLEPFDAP